MLTYILIASVSGVAGAVLAAWRLRGDRTTTEAIRAVMLGGGGPPPTTPK